LNSYIFGTHTLQYIFFRTFKRQLKTCLFHIWRVDEQKWHLPPPSAVVAFLWFRRRI